jgi:hypothetical protein
MAMVALMDAFEAKYYYSFDYGHYFHESKISKMTSKKAKKYLHFDDEYERVVSMLYMNNRRHYTRKNEIIILHENIFTILTGM